MGKRKGMGKRPKKDKPAKSLFALYDNKGKLFSTFTDQQEAAEDAVGPRFRPYSTIREYTLVPKKHKRVVGG